MSGTNANDSDDANAVAPLISSAIFATIQLMLEAGESIALLTDETFARRPLRGEDSIRIVH